MMSPLTPGAAFGPFQLVAPLGRGGMASVWKAYEAALDRFVALKVLPAEFLHEESFAARFQREARLVARLEHPSIVPIFAFGIENAIPWMSTRLIPGGSLAALLQEGPLSAPHTVGIVRQVADALTYAHGLGIAHRDVKPQNILLDSRGGVYLADFGIAKMLESEESITRTGLVSGTPQYMAPEHATGSALDHRVDIYSLGVVAYEMLTGAAPFNADTPVAVLLKHVSAPVPIPPSDLVPEALLGPLLRCLAKDPDDRWGTASEFAEALEQGLAASGAAAAESPSAVAGHGAASTPAPPASAHEPIETAVTAAVPPVAVKPSMPRGLAFYGIFAAALALGLLGFGILVARRTAPAPASARVPEPVANEQAAPPLAAPVAPAGTVPRTAGPRPVRPAPKASPSLVQPKAADAEPVEPIPPTPAGVRSPAAISFRLDVEIPLAGVASGPVRFEAIRFRKLKDALEARIAVLCESGQDQVVQYSVALLDDAGRIVETLQGRSDVDEGDRATLRGRQRIAAGALAAVRSFRIAVSSTPD